MLLYDTSQDLKPFHFLTNLQNSAVNYKQNEDAGICCKTL